MHCTRAKPKSLQFNAARLGGAQLQRPGTKLRMGGPHMTSDIADPLTIDTEILETLAPV
jgi:hypothetical protein